MFKRLFEDKRAVLFASLVAVLSLALLASALNNVTFHPAQPLIRVNEEQAQVSKVSIREVVSGFLEIPLWKRVAFFVTLLLLIALAISLLTPEMRKRLVIMIVRLAISMLVIYYLLKTNPQLLAGLIPQFNFESGAANTVNLEDVAPPAFTPPQVPDSLSFFVTLGVVLIVAVIVWRSYIWWQEQNKLHSADHPLGEIAKIARASLQELSGSQGASHDVIIQCYANMSQAVFTRRGLQRNYTMTAAEFAQSLEKAGLPREPVERLTRLFESARYSARISTQNDIDEAVSCLTLIVKYCGAAQ